MVLNIRSTASIQKAENCNENVSYSSQCTIIFSEMYSVVVGFLFSQWQIPEWVLVNILK